MRNLSALLITALTLCSATTFAAVAEEIHVQLTTESALTPVYFSRLTTSDQSFDEMYLIQLELTLEKDLGNNAKAKIAKRDPQKETHLMHKNQAIAFQAAKWKEWSIPHVIVGSIKDKKLEVKVFSSATGSLKTFPEVELSGHLVQDRRVIHKLIDQITKILFNIEGVCSSKILYSFQVNSHDTSESKWKAEIWECDWDGGGTRQVTQDGSYCITPVALPSTNRLLSDKFFYVSYKLGQPKIFLGSLKDGHGKKVVDLRGNQILPAVSPKKDKIAYICDASGRADLFLQAINPETGELEKPSQLFSFPRSSQGSPTFSPDGKKVAFVSDKDGVPRIYIIPATFSEKRAEPELLTKENKENSCPSWSPDGSKIAYSARTSGTRQIWIYDFKTNEERQLTTGPGNKENPSWAPNSVHLVFNSTDSTTSDLYVVNIFQSEAIKITKGPGKKHYPYWTARKD